MGHATGTTVNHVVLTVVAGGLREVGALLRLKR
jgi:hypothetical protein